ncbi:MAG: hypothetical protein HPY51_02535 [Candidatus Omnitrophica bacterium]|nr:hypothetical protein [Candidatus Omnitrophota bacterium]
MPTYHARLSQRHSISCLTLGVAVWLTCPFPAHAWEGHQWENWLAVTQQTKPDIRSPQAGFSDLLPLLQSTLDPTSKIDSIQAWETKRDAILGTLQAILGEPSDLKPVPPYAEVLGEEDLGTYLRRHIRVATEMDDWIPAYLLIPKPVPTTPRPVMIVLHQTVAQGKDEPCGIKGNAKLALALELVQRGFVCLAPDAIGFGERIPAGTQPYHESAIFYRKHPRWSFMGKMVWDVQRLVDYLETLPFADPYRIGCIGHSHGAYGTLFATIFEPRISAAVASCGFTTLRADPAANRWSHLTPLMPRLGFYLEPVDEIPFDWHEILACAAPRPLFNWSTLNDDIFPNTDNLRNIYTQLRQVYALYGAADSLDTRLEPGPHSFPREVREAAYRWLETHLAARPDLKRSHHTLPATREEWEAFREELKSLLLRDIGPVNPPGLPVEVEILAATPQHGYTEKKIRYLAAPDDPVTAYLLLPDSRQEKNPAMIVFHQTTEFGKEEPAGHAGRASIQFGPELVRRGYIVLIPDSITAGERIGPHGPFDTRTFYERFSNLSALGKMIQDGRRALDILQSFPEVDTGRIGAIGHSLGAEEALFTAAFDERLQAAAASCGYAPLRADANPGRWARDHWFSYLPRLRIELRAGRLPAWDFEDVIRLVAPRGYFNYQTSGDAIFPEGYAAHAMTLSTRGLWRLYGVEERLRSRLDPGPHDITPEAKEEIYTWLDTIVGEK